MTTCSAAKEPAIRHCFCPAVSMSAHSQRIVGVQARRSSSARVRPVICPVLPLYSCTMQCLCLVVHQVAPPRCRRSCSSPPARRTSSGCTCTTARPPPRTHRSSCGGAKTVALRFPSRPLCWRPLPRRPSSREMACSDGWPLAGVRRLVAPSLRCLSFVFSPAFHCLSLTFHCLSTVFSLSSHCHFTAFP